MTPKDAARRYAAALIEAQLAAAHVEYEESSVTAGPDGRPYRLNVRTVIDTFEKAPWDVRAALNKGLDGDEVAEEMLRLAEELRRPRCVCPNDGSSHLIGCPSRRQP